MFVTEDCPAGDREDIRQDLRIKIWELLQQREKDGKKAISLKVLMRFLVSRRDRYIRKYKLGGITLAPTDPQTETIGIDEHPAANALCYGGCIEE